MSLDHKVFRRHLVEERGGNETAVVIGTLLRLVLEKGRLVQLLPLDHRNRAFLVFDGHQVDVVLDGRFRLHESVVLGLEVLFLAL